MNSIRYFLFLTLNFLVLMVHAQDFKVIEETKDYILKECDSVYYYSHGIEPKDDFVLDTTKIHKVNGVLKLPLDNGKEVVFRDKYDKALIGEKKYEYFGYEKWINQYLIVEEGYEWGYYISVNKANGEKDTLNSQPVYSPSYNNYGYAFADRIFDSYGKVTFKNIKSNRKINILFNNELPNNFKWIDDASFVFYTDVWDIITNEIIKKKYYLVQIKQ